MSIQAVHTLLIEDNPGDIRLIRELVTEVSSIRFTWQNVVRLSEAKEALRVEPFDLVLLDLSLPDSQGLDTFNHLHPHAACLPVVVLTNLEDEWVAVEAVRTGAQDYLVKGQLDGAGVVRALRYAMERKRTEIALRARNQQLAVITEQLWQKASHASSTDELISRLIDELNNPLATVSGLLQELVSQFPASDPRRQRLQTIHTEVERMGRLVASLLQDSIERGNQEQENVLSHLQGQKIGRLEQDETRFFEALGAWVADYMLRRGPMMPRRLRNYLKRLTESGEPVHPPLSPREHEVVHLIALGYTNKEIAKRLSISVRTVERHSTSIMNKLGLKKRAELIAYAVRQGIVSGEDIGERNGG